ncbi:MAG: glycosyltransferase family 4 protein [Parcubacteria group bacterium]|nr:glycosyltransferase family 4 protein [Parcubacteria group bacterium]
MRILIVTGIFEPEIGGPAEYTPKLAAGLIARGHTVKVLTYSAKPDFSSGGGSAFGGDAKYPFPLERVVRTNKFSNYVRFFLAALRNVPNYDIIYSLDWFTAGLPLALAARLAGKKYLLRIGGGYIWEKYLNDGNPPLTLMDFYKRGIHKRYPLMYRTMKFVLHGAERIIFNSDIQRNFYAPQYGLSPERLTTIYNPISKTLVPVLRDEQQREIIFAGRMIAKNNIENCIRAFSSSGLSDYTLTLIGDGFITWKMRTLADGLGLKNVIFLPAMRQEKLYERIRNARYVILPSWTDISPNTAYECLSLGIPFLITTENYLSIRDQIPLMIDPRSVGDMAEKMRLLSEEDAYKEYCAKLHAIEFRHDWDDVCSEHLEIFNKCLEVDRK